MLTAEDLERVYARYTSSCWRGDPAGETLEHWFRVHWVEASPHQPDTDPAAVSPHGAGGRGILWYEGSSASLGFIPGRSGCYVVKRTESTPVVVDLTPLRTPHPAQMKSVAHFQAGTFARRLTLARTQASSVKE